MNVLFFISHQPNPRFVKQINFLSQKNQVSLAYFLRETLADLDSSIEKEVNRYNFGRIPNASRLFKRLWTYFKTINKIRKIVRSNAYDVILINNIDILLLYVLSRFGLSKKNYKSKVVIEISDLREFVFKDSFVSKIMRYLERKLYRKYVDKLIVTSNKYYTYHFKNFFNKDIFILENKLISQEIIDEDLESKLRSEKTIIGIVGLLLRKDEYIQLFETYKNSLEVEIHIYGKGQYQNVVEEYASKYENISYFGPYNTFTDARRIYNSIDIIYLVYDIEQVSLNNRLALPNKLYECMYYKVPLICSKQTYLEEIVIHSKIGVSIDYRTPGEIENAVNSIMENKNSIKSILENLSPEQYLGDNDYIKLESFLLQ
ncbi:glycosyl transferase family 1 [Flavobacteriaceae bacterium MHTCC 0001]